MSLGENRRVSAYGFQPKISNGDGFLPGTKPEQHSCSYCKLTTSQNHHFPSAPLAIITTSLPHHFPSSPLPFCHLFPKSRRWNKLKWRINSTNFLLALGSRPILTKMALGQKHQSRNRCGDLAQPTGGNKFARPPTKKRKKTIAVEAKSPHSPRHWMKRYIKPVSGCFAPLR